MQLCTEKFCYLHDNCKVHKLKAKNIKRSCISWLKKFLQKAIITKLNNK